MSTTFTPGPWTDKSSDESQWGIYDSRGWSVAQAHQIKVLSADIKQVERTANTRLIAAAPDLYEALLSLVDNLDGGDFISATRIDVARAALAKAKGKA